MKITQAEHTKQHRTFDIIVGAHKIRIVLDLNSRSGCYSPAVNAYLSGPNGSPAGVGPKSWPMPLPWLFGVRYDKHAPRKRNASMLQFRVPHLTFMRAYKLRRVGGLKLYRLNSRAIRAIIVKP